MIFQIAVSFHKKIEFGSVIVLEQLNNYSKFLVFFVKKTNIIKKQLFLQFSFFFKIYLSENTFFLLVPSVSIVDNPDSSIIIDKIKEEINNYESSRARGKKLVFEKSTSELLNGLEQFLDDFLTNILKQKK